MSVFGFSSYLPKVQCHLDRETRMKIMENSYFTLVSACHENTRRSIFVFEEAIILGRGKKKGNLVLTFCAVKVSD